MLTRLVEWVLECSVSEPENAPWLALVKALLCYAVRLAVLIALMAMAAEFGANLVKNAL